MFYLIFFFTDTATTEIYTLSLHDALPISDREKRHPAGTQVQGLASIDRPRAVRGMVRCSTERHVHAWADRKSTRLNSSHMSISYAVFCLKKKRQDRHHPSHRDDARRDDVR